MNNLCIVGLGMIGGSLAAALRKVSFDGQITALVRSDKTGERGLAMNLIDHYSTSASDVIPDADIVILAVPMLSMAGQLKSIAPHVQSNTIITDAGSVKGPFIADAKSILGSLNRVVPGHPIAGREKTGVDAADANLFRHRKVILTPTDSTDIEAIARVDALWSQTGASVEVMDPEQHDRVLAATSHLPHVLAFALVDTLATQQEAEEIFKYAAGGFRDFTRIASSDAVMWRDICLSNRGAILESIDRLGVHLKKLRTAIDESDGQQIQEVFARAKKARDKHT